jgi:4-amino-4-deoxy-L-arabinose transferase-like glycosyltransferase
MVRYQSYLPRIILILFLIAALCVGYFTAQDYGLSWDELGIYGYSDQMLAAYQFILHPWDFESQVSDPLLNLYGPSHFMLSTVLSRYLNGLDKTWSLYEAHHFIYFLTFLLGIPVLYLLCIRWMSEWAALGVAVLFSTQPLFWGNSFINPKDMPFMIFFLASMYLGLQMVDSSSNSTWWKTIAAGVVLGLTTSIRSLGPMAGALVILYGLWKDPRKTLRIIPLYFSIIAVITYLTWPYLWNAPVSRFLESLQTMSSHPMDFGVLFMGNIYPANQIPIVYFPTFIALQLTEPMLVLIVIGAVLSFRFFIGGGNKEPVLLFGTWFLAPALVIGLIGSTIYDNARQLLFLLPPLFIFAGIGLDAILKRIKTPLLQGVLALALILPGVYANIRLHPYQYIYYNELIGGVGGAFRKFDLDYSGTSFKEAQKYINSNSEPNTKTVVIVGPRHLSRIYARASLKENLLGVFDTIDPNGPEYYYVLFLTRANSDLNTCANGEIVYSIERDGGALAYIRKIYSKEPCWKDPLDQ